MIVAMPLRVKGRHVQLAVMIVNLRKLRSVEEHLASCAIVRPQTPHYLRMTSSFFPQICHAFYADKHIQIILAILGISCIL